ncbi:LysE family translocator [Afifella sp. IM 167]|uniref:LysE family translocator n=1 Tax=Afifella sp. IM 167 TaxID=2033586 RepID=UPI001CCDE66D|nr:LysE family translocator [Afifella sp. IM 167]MBZ8134035.1 lysine transporter LysE [Afifella sp. IM 167]
MIAWGLFIPACFAVNCAPGPNNMLAFSNAARLGPAKAFAGGLGRMFAFVILIAITIVGLGAVLAASAEAFFVVKMAGAVYLLYVGVQILRRARRLAAVDPASVGIRELMRRDFTVAITNPKAIALFTAFFPQFIDPAYPAWEQLARLGGAFLVLEVAAVAIYVAAGALLKGALRSQGVFVWLNRLVGTALIASGASMAATSR